MTLHVRDGARLREVERRKIYRPADARCPSLKYPIETLHIDTFIYSLAKRGMC